MRNKFTVTISDIHGAKHYTLHQIIKKFIVYFTLFVIAVIVIGVLLIKLLSTQLDTLNQKKQQVDADYLALVQKSDTLKRNYEKQSSTLQDMITKKTEELDAIKEKVSDIEELVGLKPPKEMDISERIDVLSITSLEKKKIFDNIPNGYPIPYKGISGRFGWRSHPILKKKEFHKGLDLRGKAGTPIKAPADGIIEFSGFHKRSGFGNLVIIDHNYGFKTNYAHLKKAIIKEGDFVKKGDIIGYVGSSGLSTGPHLHYEIRYIQRVLNPINFVKWNKSNFETIFKKEKRVSWQSLLKAISHQHQLQQQRLSLLERK